MVFVNGILSLFLFPFYLFNLVIVARKGVLGDYDFNLTWSRHRTIKNLTDFDLTNGDSRFDCQMPAGVRQESISERLGGSSP